MTRELHHVRYVRQDETSFRFTCVETGRTGTHWVHYLRDGDDGVTVWDGRECQAEHVNVRKKDGTK